MGDTTPVGSAWGAGGSGSATQTAREEGNDDATSADLVPAKSKKKGKQKSAFVYPRYFPELVHSIVILLKTL